jgi:hypothetical protein
VIKKSEKVKSCKKHKKSRKVSPSLRITYIKISSGLLGATKIKQNSLVSVK